MKNSVLTLPLILKLALVLMLGGIMTVSASESTTKTDGIAFGTNQAVYQSKIAALDLSQAATFETVIWIDPESAEGARILDNSVEPFVDDAANCGCRLELTKSGSGYGLKFTTGMKIPLEYAGPLPVKQWVHIAAIFSNNARTTQLYVDGKSVGSQAKNEYSTWLRSSLPLYLGADSNGNHRFVGHIKSVGVWPSCLSESDISNLANDIKVNDACAFWRLNDEKITTEVDDCPALVPVKKVLGTTKTPASPLTLWYTQPAKQWTEALPVGNGHLAAMVYGDPEVERLALNEDTIWAGGPYDPANVNAYDAIGEARKLIFEGKNSAAEALLNEKAMSNPLKQCSYQPFGDLQLFFTNASGSQVTDYIRTLDINNAITTTHYSINGVNMTREVFVSAPDDVIVMRLTASQPKKLNFTAVLSTPHSPKALQVDGNTLVLTGTSGKGSNGKAGQIKFEGRLLTKSKDGQVVLSKAKVTVKDATSVVLLFAAATNYVNYNNLTADPSLRAKTALDKAAQKSYLVLKQRHITNYHRLFHRVSLNLGAGRKDQPTDQRVENFADCHDPGLTALYFQFGRYLLISSSRSDQPANLQGIWNDLMAPPWNSKYTININTEMNYWLAEPTNLSECTVPLFNMIKDIAVTGRTTAKVMYKANGWVTHHNVDLWRATGPIDGAKYGYWPVGGAWLTTHMWEHYLFTGERKFLAECYPIWKEACQFFMDTLVTEPTHGWLVTSPSLSPEHGGNVAGPTMDLGIIRDLFTQTEQAGEILGIDTDFRATLLAVHAKLAPYQIGKFGQLQEWLSDIDLENDSHKHCSHLYPLFPSAQITSEQPELFKAALKSLKGRGDSGTGWSKAWKINLWARALDGDHSYKLVSEAIKLNTYPNLFDAHPPFQIDGNFGGTSGITEMLLQSHAGYIHILPALPTIWPSGFINGLVARGGFVTRIQWDNGDITRVKIFSRLGNPCQLKLGNGEPFRVTCHGKPVNIQQAGKNSYRFETAPNTSYEIIPQ